MQCCWSQAARRVSEQLGVVILRSEDKRVSRGQKSFESTKNGSVAVVSADNQAALFSAVNAGLTDRERQIRAAHPTPPLISPGRSPFSGSFQEA
jgi:hypothetical protein